MVMLPGRAREAANAGLRERLSEFRALLVISLLMTESVSEDQILELAASSAPALGPWRIEGYGFIDGSWRPGMGYSTPVPCDLAGQLAKLGSSAGQMELPGRRWAWAFPLRSVSGPLGHLVASCQREPSSEERFLIRVIAQQTGVAVSNARLHASERATASELAATNAALAETVTSLRRSMDIHHALTRVAVSGEGQGGIAKVLHDLTGMPVAIEDRYGNLSAWAGPGKPDPYPKESFAKREHLLRRLMRDSKPIRDGERLVLLVSPRPDLIGVVALIDPGRSTDNADLVALEHAATVLSMELARLRSIADTELRLQRDLVHDLLAGTDDESAQARAEALDYDLRRPHRVAVIEGRGRSQAHDALLTAVRRAMRVVGQDGLFETRSGNVVVVTAGQADWEKLRRMVVADLGGGQCYVGVGDPCARPSELPRSLREAGLALRLQKTLLPGSSACEYPKLGIFRMLAAIPNLTDVDAFVREWLGSLLDYDAHKGSELVHTLTQYLEHGGNYDATAADLSVHKSTLKYRLQRIRDLTGLELNNPDVHFNLQLATRAWGTLQALQGDRLPSAVVIVAGPDPPGQPIPQTLPCQDSETRAPPGLSFDNPLELEAHPCRSILTSSSCQRTQLSHVLAASRMYSTAASRQTRLVPSWSRPPIWWTS
jgi:sugar diacid utilization regulator